MLKTLRQTALMLLWLTIVTGVIYPLAVTGLAQAIFVHQANGSLIYRSGKPVGSTLIGQEFTEAKYFWPRPSATPGVPYNAAASGASNLGVSNPKFVDAVKQRVAHLRAADPTHMGPVPVDLVTSSASGLDPDISVAGAMYQLDRVAKARGLKPETVRGLVHRYTTQRWLGVIGEPVVNVVKLNLALDALAK